MKKIQLSKADIEAAKAFTLARTEASSFYKGRGGFKEEDIMVGALAELGVYSLLRDNGIIVNEPDFAIHNVEKKSFNADLTDGHSEFHVKGQSLDSASKYGKSWLMQRHDPIFTKCPPNNYIVPTTVDLNEGIVSIHGIFSISYLVHNNCLGEPKLAHLRSNKVAIYKSYLDAVSTEASKWALLNRRNNGR